MNKINNLLKQGNLTKNEIKGKIEKTMNIYLAKYNGDISVYKKKMAQKIEEVTGLKDIYSKVGDIDV